MERNGVLFSRCITDRGCKHSVFLSPQYLFYTIDWCIVVRKAQVDDLGLFFTVVNDIPADISSTESLQLAEALEHHKVSHVSQ